MEETCQRRRSVRSAVAAIAFGATLLACSPAFDWRETRPEGSGAVAMFPCRPVKQERSVRIGAAVLPGSLKQLPIFALFVLVLLFRPNGLLNRTSEVKL